MYAVVHFPLKGNQFVEIEILCRLADKFSPLYEVIDGRTIAIKIDGLSLLYPKGNEEILAALEREARQFGEANIAVGSNLSLVILTALCRAGAVLVESAEPVGEATIECLKLPAKYLETFRDWGIATIAQLIDLPPDELIARLGREILPIIEDLRATSRRPIRAFSAERKFSRAINLDDPVEEVETCLHLIKVKLNDLLVELSSYGLAAAEIGIFSVKAHEKTQLVYLKLPIPSLNFRYLTKLLEYEFEALAPEEPIKALEVEIVPTPPRRVQPTFWQPPSPDPESLELTLGKLKKLLGAENVGVPVILDSHRTTAFDVDTKARPASIDVDIVRAKGVVAFRFLPEVLPARFIGRIECPQFLQIRKQKLRICRISGPWLSSGDWWDPLSWQRRELDVQTTGGQIFRVVQTGNDEFLVEGYYD